MINSNNPQIIDADSLDKIPANRRAKAESWVQDDILYNEIDKEDGSIPSGKSVGDVKIPSHTRYRVQWDPEEENAALEARIAALESA